MQLATVKKQPKPLPKDKAWFTSNTELYTNEGWVNIAEVTSRDLLLMTLDAAGHIRPREILSFSTMQYNADIQFFEYSDIYMEFRYAFPLTKNSFLPSFENKEENIYGRKKYKGILYNISVPNGTVFVRHPKCNHKGKTLLAQTAIVLEEVDLLDDEYDHTEAELEKEKEFEFDPGTGLPIYNTNFEEPIVLGMNKKKQGLRKGKASKRFRTLSHPNYYLCRVSW